MRFRGELQDLVKKEVLVNFHRICAPCSKMARIIAWQRLKRTTIYRKSEEIRELVRVMENMEDVDTAGYEFDVLPEELHRYALIIMPVSHCGCGSVTEIPAPGKFESDDEYRRLKEEAKRPIS